MPRLRTLVYNTTFFLVCLLAFLLVFENQLQVPGWLQVAGRMHPLFLHFPITVLILYGFGVIVAPRPKKGEALPMWADDVLLLGAFTATFTALLGLLLSQETGYEQDVIFWHKWTGIATAFISFGWYSFRNRLPTHLLPTKLLAGGTIVVLLFAGHLGANITHGEEFLLAPIMSDQGTPAVAMDDALVFAHVVQPILKEKCMGCHNPQKAKGELIMSTAELLAKGGKEGVPWDTTQADLGLLLRRAHLPLDDKKHMPPRGKVQLSEDEIQVLESWIRGGSSFTAKVVEFPADDPLFRFASERLGVSEAEETYEFAAADASKVRELNTNYRVITPLAAGSPALSVSFFSEAAFKSSDLTDLTLIKDQIVELDASKMPVKDEDLKLIAQFTNLRKLLLNFTDITGGTLGELNKLPHLRQLSLTGTPVNVAQLRTLKNAPALNSLYVWNTDVKPEEFIQLRKELKGITFESGYRSDTVVLKLNPPQIVTKDQILSGDTVIQLKHQIAGTVIRYTLDDTEPDSLTSPIYKNGVPIKDNARLKARAYKPGWYGSDVVQRFFYRNTFRPDSVLLLTTPAPQYNGTHGKVLADGVKGGGDFKNGKWTGFMDEPLTALLSFKRPVTAQKISLSMLQNVGASIFPPVKLEVWGGMESDKLKLLGTQKPPMPSEKEPNNGEKLFEVSFQPTPIRFIKVVAVPIARLPSWHPQKGLKGWVFMDEVLVN
ncbi:FN3 associated domain-containing protein [Salmonirosea aquatica]|uniref:Cytochrome c domain-containing protein n=1 Tax=Salmonirosea aquatica TaxID=2654236 RepID=A0A7C9BKP4_9BACT|nr:hypothetical protein [Cytophagaceae bacterium SJW1-29]